MFCPHCGTRAVEHSRFCHHCAAALPVIFASSLQPALQSQELPIDQKSRTARNVKTIIIGVGGPIVLLMIGIVIVAFIKESKALERSTTLNNLANSANEVVKTEQRSKLLSEAQVVQPGRFCWQEFEIRADMAPARVVGSFAASGGSGNDILIYIVDEYGLVNVKNGHATETYYNSRQVTAGQLNVQLSSGKYYLVMDNTFSLLSNKVVRNDIELVYYQ